MFRPQKLNQRRFDIHCIASASAAAAAAPSAARRWRGCIIRLVYTPFGVYRCVSQFRNERFNAALNRLCSPSPTLTRMSVLMSTAGPASAFRRCFPDRSYDDVTFVWSFDCALYGRRRREDVFVVGRSTCVVLHRSVAACRAVRLECALCCRPMSARRALVCVFVRLLWSRFVVRSTLQRV